MVWLWLCAAFVRDFNILLLQKSYFQVTRVEFLSFNFSPFHYECIFPTGPGKRWEWYHCTTRPFFPIFFIASSVGCICSLEWLHFCWIYPDMPCHVCAAHSHMSNSTPKRVVCKWEWRNIEQIPCLLAVFAKSCVLRCEDNLFFFSLLFLICFIWLIFRSLCPSWHHQWLHMHGMDILYFNKRAYTRMNDC